MDVLIFSLNAILPIVLITASGYFLKRIKLLDEGFIKKANDLCFKFVLPIQLFQNIRSTPFSEVFSLGLVLYVLVGITALCLLLCLIVPRFIKSRSTSGAFIQGVFRSNFLLLGLPLAINMFGEDNVSSLSMLMPFVIIAYNFLAVIVLTFFSEDRNGKKPDFKSVFIGIVKNPLIIASVFGVVFSVLSIGLPKALETTLDTLGKMATPLSLIILGGQFEPKLLKGNIGLCAVASVLKLVAVPLIFVLGAILLGYRNEDLGAVLILFCAPTAVSSYVMAKSMNNNHVLAGQIVVFTTVLSAVTIFIWTFVLKQFNFI